MLAATGLLLLLTSSSTEAWVTPKPVHRSVATRAVVDDETNYNPELYSPKAIKTIRKEVAKLRKTNKLTGFALPSGDPDIHLTEDDDVEVEFTPETLSQVESLLEVHELVEVQKLSPGNIKLVYDVAAELAMQVGYDTAVVDRNEKAHKAVLFRRKEDGSGMKLYTSARIPF